MNRRKLKLLYFILTIFLIVGVTGCGDKKNVGSQAGSETSASEVTTELVTTGSVTTELDTTDSVSTESVTAESVTTESVANETETTESPTESDTEISNEDSSESEDEEETETASEEKNTSEINEIAEDGTYTSKEYVALYIFTYNKLPSNFITKKEAKKLGWSGGSLEDFAPGKCIGGDKFGNYEGTLPEYGTYHECDIDTLGKSKRGAKRIVYSDDGRIYYTGDHYETFELLYGEER